MSSQYRKVISLILSERFGTVIEQIGSYLFQYGPAPLLFIKRGTNLPLAKVKEALCVLIKYRLVYFKPNNNENVANYSLHHEHVLLMLRYPKYINLIKKKFGDDCEIMIEELLQHSYLAAPELILKVMERLKNDHNKTVSVFKLKDKFIALLTAKYLIRLPYPKDSSPVPQLELRDDEAFQPPKIVLHDLVQNGKNSDSLQDNEVYWTVNFDRFHQDFRDRLIVANFTRKFDENAGEFLRLLLQQMYIRSEPWVDISNPVPVVEIRDAVRKQATHQHLLAFFDQYVNVIEQDSSKLIRKSGDASGGSYQIHLKEAFTLFIWEAIEQIILEKYDTKAARIFRLVKLKKFIEPDQIQQLVMIPAKDAKRLAYQLLEENFLQILELKKAISNGPHKSFNLFHIELDQVVRMVVEMCFKTLFNVMMRKNHEKLMNKRIIDKKQRVDTILMGMKAQGADSEQLADIEEMITPPEREMLSKIDATMKKLNIVELELDDSLFLFQMYLKYQ